MDSRRQRFTSDGNDVVSKDVQLTLSILQAIEMPNATHQDLVKGLNEEITSNISLQIDWNQAVSWLGTKNGNEWAKNKEYHLALRTFSLNTFYGEFNEVK